MKYWTLIAFLFGLVLMFFIMRYFNKPEKIYAPVNNDSLFKKVDSLSALSELYLLKYEESRAKEAKNRENEQRLRQMINDLNEKVDIYTKSDILLWLNVYERTNRYGVYSDSANEIVD